MYELKELVVYSLSEGYAIKASPALLATPGLRIDLTHGLWYTEGWPRRIGRPRYRWNEREGVIGVFCTREPEHTEEINNIKCITELLRRSKAH